MQTKNYLLILVSVLFINQTSAQDFKPLFNGKDLSGWYSFLKDKGKNNDSNKVFTVNNGLLRITGQDFGYIITEKSFTDFHLKVEFKWGEKKYPPRENAIRDNGICYYVTSKDKVWPRSVECQIQEGDCGDFWLIDSTSIVIDGKQYGPTGNTRVIKKQNNEKPTGEWNTIEVIANKGKCTHIVNGMVVNEGENVNLRSGRILIQSEGAEIYYRKIEIKEL